MRSFFANKINILLSFLLIATLGAAGFLGYTLINSNKEVTVPDLLGKNEQEVFEWCGQLDAKYACEMVYEESKSVEKGIVFQQSINAGSTLADKITFKISSGLIKQVDLPQLYNATRVEIEKWQSKNKLQSVEYIDEYSDTISKGTIIGIEPSENIYPDTEIKVYVSAGKEGSSEIEGDIEVKAGEYLNLTVARFETQVKELGLVPNHNTSRDTYSSSVAKGNIVWHGSGTYEKGETINYGVCIEGSDSDIIVKSGTYVGKTEDEFKTIASDLGLKANHNSERDAYSDTVTKGNIVWHGSGTYVKNETFNYGLSLGKKDGSSDSDEIKVTQNQYVGKTEAEFKTIAEGLGLKPTHVSTRDAYSDTVAKGSIVTHGYGTYEKNEEFNYGLSLGKKDGSSESDEIKVTQNQYVGKTEAEFKTIAEGLGLKPTHISSRDAYSDTVAKGSIVTHGYGTYEKNEAFNYGLSLGKKDGSSSDEIKVTQNQYVGKTEAEFKTIAEGLGLKPTHISSRDAYSDTVTKGSIVTHGYGTYEKNEAFNYGLSLGKAPDDSVTVSSKANSSEADFKTYISNLGLSLGTKSSEYSDSVTEGYIIRNDTGTFKKGDKINYTVSLGKAPEQTGRIMWPEKYELGSNPTYESTKAKMQGYLSVFTNLSFEAVTSTKTIGRIEKIEVGDYGSSYPEGDYPINTPIKIYIVSQNP